jgi:hypothetical protein
MLEVSVSRRNPRVKIFLLEYFGIHARYSSGSLETLICLIVPEGKNRVAALAAAVPKFPSLYSKFFGKAF